MLYNINKNLYVFIFKKKIIGSLCNLLKCCVKGKRKILLYSLGKAVKL